MDIFNQASGDKTSIVLHGLDSGTKYLIRMQSINGEGAGLPSEQIQAETDSEFSSLFILGSSLSSKHFFQEYQYQASLINSVFLQGEN